MNIYISLSTSEYKDGPICVDSWIQERSIERAINVGIREKSLTMPTDMDHIEELADLEDVKLEDLSEEEKFELCRKYSRRYYGLTSEPENYLENDRVILEISSENGIVTVKRYPD